jgi:hypothetical protein
MNSQDIGNVKDMNNVRAHYDIMSIHIFKFFFNIESFNQDTSAVEYDNQFKYKPHT